MVFDANLGIFRSGTAQETMALREQHSAKEVTTQLRTVAEVPPTAHRDQPVQRTLPASRE